MTRFLALLFLSSLLAVTQAAESPEQQQLDEARARWLAADVPDYRYVYQKFCTCYSGEPPEIVVTISDGQVTRAFSRNDYSEREVPAGEDRLDLYWTVEDLFGKLAAAYARGVHVEAGYDPELGYPVRIFIDDFADFTGEETDIRLTGFEVL